MQKDYGESRQVYLEIEDTGVGITEEDLPKIFEPFFTYGKRKGFGLGLFISKTIVDKHQGKIFVESQIGSGTRITIVLPSYEEVETIQEAG